MESVERKMRIPSSVDEIRHVQTAVQREMKRFGYGRDACFGMKLALEESLINAIKHGNHFDRGRWVHVRYEIDDRRAKVTVRDEGAGFDPDAVPDPTSDENLTKPSGRGIMLMRAYMDDVSYGADGCEVCMVKNRR